MFLWYCLPKTVGLEGLLNLPARELEHLVDFQRTIVLACFLSDNVA